MEDFAIVSDDVDPGDSAGESPAVAADPSPGPTIDARGAVAWSRRLLLPFKVDGRMLRTVALHYPTQGDIDDFASGELETLRHVLCRLTGLHPSVIRALRWPDSEAVHQAFKDLLPSFIVEELEG